MTTEFDDELLSAVLDGDADPQTVAAVQADPDAAARLRSMQAAAALVATPPPPATPERRAASIAAALAAAQPAPEVSSLSVARERKAAATAPPRRQVNWLAIAAAFAFVLISAVVLSNVIGGGDSFDTATESSATVDDASDSASDTAEESAMDSADSRLSTDSGDSGTSAAAMSEMATDDAMEEDAMDLDADDAAMEDAMENQESAVPEGPAPSTTTTIAVEQLLVPQEFLTLDELETAIADGLVVPELTLIDLEVAGVVNPACFDPQTEVEEIRFALVDLGEFAPPPQLVVVQFDPPTPDDILIFDAETCSPVG